MQRDISLEDKVAFLRRPDSYPDQTKTVDTVETHFAWIFLTERFAYKLKKPIRFEQVDLRSSAARRANCELEITLNRRLAEQIYLGIVPLTASDSGLGLGGETGIVDWLVRMRRLPAALTLEAAAARDAVSDRHLAAVMEKLASFYRSTPRAPWNAAEYARSLHRRSRKYADQLAAPELGIDTGLIGRLAGLHAAFLSDSGALLERRIDEGRIVDAHGDLKPEHIFLTQTPQIIDCLEFSIELRWLDMAEELSFLALECDRLGHPVLARRLLAIYREKCADDPPRILLDFYRSQRAFVRALLCAWHVPDSDPKTARDWFERSAWYLQTAEASMLCARRTAEQEDSARHAEK